MAARKKSAAVVVRAATRADLPSLATIFAASHAWHVRQHPRFFAPLSPTAASAVARRDLESALADAYEHFCVATIDDAVVGFAHARLHDTPARPELVAERRAELVQIAVAPAARRRGVAKRLFAAIDAWAALAGARSLVLSVWSGNRAALAFYRGQRMTAIHQVLSRPVRP